MRRIVLCLLITVCLVGAPVLAAGGEKGDWELGLFAGMGFLDDYDGSSPGALNPDDDLLYGGRIGFFFTPRWSLEYSFQTLESTMQFAPSLGSAIQTALPTRMTGVPTHRGEPR